MRFFLMLAVCCFLFVTTCVFGQTPSSSPDKSSEYVIDPENALSVDVFYGKGEKISQRVRVSSAGSINFPLVGEVQVSGLTVAQVQEKLALVLGKDYLVNPQVTVFIEEYSTVSVMGEVRNPGAYPIKGRLSVVGLISLAGGFGETASPNMVKVIHTNPDGTKTETVIRVLDMIRGTGADDGLFLHAGDVVMVPKSTVSIIGEVKKPGTYPTKGQLTVLELISLAEGFTDTASPNEVKVVRMNPDGTKNERIVPVLDIMNKKLSGDESIFLSSGDVVSVPEGKVSIMGEVRKPGSYATKGQLSITELISLAEGFTETASPNEVKVVHTNADGTKTERIIPVLDVMNKKTVADETLLLNPGDIVSVPEGKVSIMGEVRKPGAYATKGHLTVLELIALAEGFSKIAAPNKVKVIHTNPDGTKSETIIRVNDLMNKNSSDNQTVTLSSGDVVIVPESMF